VIIDEVHERDKFTDFVLILLKVRVRDKGIRDKG
jgi:HrpA-like RNA helicase